MKKTVVIDSIFEYERTALLEDGELKEIIFEEKGSFNVGDIVVGKIKKILPNKFIFIDIGDEKSAFLCLTDKKEKNLFKFDEYKKKNVLKFKEGDEILVQIQKYGTDLKGICVTSKISLTGKYAVILLNDNHIGISKKIESNREELKKIAEEILPENYGIILRTNCQNIEIETLKKEIIDLVYKSKEIIEKSNYIKAPKIIYKEKKESEKLIVDLLNFEDEIFINNIERKEEIEKLKIFENIKLYDDKLPIFEAFCIETQIEKLFNNKIWLKSGGFIVIDEIEAMTIIDVNTGKNIEKNFEKMILKTNLEAIKEIAKQINLRNLNGMIMIDLIDMENKEDREKVFEEMKKYSKKDRQPITVYPINELGILPLTRKKGRNSISKMIMNTCNICNGTGKIKNENYICNTIKNKIISILSNTIYNKITINCHIKVSNNLNKNIEFIKQKYNACIEIHPINTTKLDYFEIEKTKI